MFEEDWIEFATLTTLQVEPDLIERPEEELQRLIEQYSEAIQSKQKQHDILHFNQNDSKKTIYNWYTLILNIENY